MAIKRIVLTGGPCSGKTKIINHLSSQFSDRVLLVPEMATLVDFSNISRNTEDERRDFQTAIYRMQVFYEELIQSHAERLQRNVICDRGTLDGAAYWPDNNFYEALRIDRIEEYKKYDLVIFLSSLSCALPEQYARVKHQAARTETVEEARQLQQKLLDVWSEHPNIKFIQNVFDDVSQKVSAVLDILIDEKII